jgi:hypothetical protein
MESQWLETGWNLAPGMGHYTYLIQIYTVLASPW